MEEGTRSARHQGLTSGQQRLHAEFLDTSGNFLIAKSLKTFKVTFHCSKVSHISYVLTPYRQECFSIEKIPVFKIFDDLVLRHPHFSKETRQSVLPRTRIFIIVIRISLILDRILLIKNCSFVRMPPLPKSFCVILKFHKLRFS